MSIILDNIKNLLEEPLKAKGLWVVQVRLMGRDNNKTLQIMVDTLDNSVVNLSNCEEASDIISAILDVEDIIVDKYNLEVSTPGIDRPLVRLEDWKKYVGHLVKVETNVPLLNGHRSFRGEIISCEDNEIMLQNDTVEVKLSYQEIEIAKLVLTDKLIDFSNV